MTAGSSATSPHRLLRSTAAMAMAALAAAAADQAFRVRRALRLRPQRATGFERRLPHPVARVLVLGDSTGVGEGAGDPGLTLAGLLAADVPGLEIVNHSEPGIRIDDVVAMAPALHRAGDRFDLLLLHLGGNDVLRTLRLAPLEDAADTLLARLSTVATHRLWLGPADLGCAPLFSAPFAALLSWRTQRLCGLLEQVTRRHGVEYLPFHAAAHSAIFRRQPARYFSADGVHPSAQAYRYCYEWLKRSPAVKEVLASAAASSERS
jgi:lysophospholipase L1-like esterase